MATTHRVTLTLSATDDIDVHGWRFTPTSFRLVFFDFLNLNLIGLEIKAEFDSVAMFAYLNPHTAYLATSGIHRS
ncbi:hypothetical protein MCEGE14_02289 [Burkholderiaceae bacterium]